jgi:hypothetical protein
MAPTALNLERLAELEKVYVSILFAKQRLLKPKVLFLQNVQAPQKRGAFYLVKWENQLNIPVLSRFYFFKTM